MPFPNPNCPTCHGSGEVEAMKYQSGELVAIEYITCPCTRRPLVVEEEDWSNGRDSETLR
jgi:hypothetical protein